MHQLISFDQQILSAERANLQALSSAVLYGKGVFTTIAVYNQKPFQWEKHWLRLLDNAARIGLNCLPAETDVFTALRDIIAKNKVVNGRARLTILDESASSLWSFAVRKKTGFLITTADFRSFDKDWQITFSAHLVNSTSPLANIKSCNYLENLLALEEAQKKGFDEAIRLNERGEIVSACLANIFWLKDEKIFTPSLQTGCLAGTTRSLIMEKYAVREVEADALDLENSDAVFLTSAGIGIRQAFLNKKHIKSTRFIDLLPFAK